jgi:hypothetical protein
MGDVIGRRCLVFLVASWILVGCSTEPDRQWYKPGTNYTVAEFTRDRDGCTKDGELNELCMKERGWFPLSGDRPPETAPKPPPERGRY